MLVSTIQFSAESIVYLLDIAYFRYISNDWIWLQMPNIFLSLVAIIWILSLPETPRYLVAKKRYDKARESFKMIAKWNGINPAQIDNWVFEQEAEDLRLASERPIGVETDETENKNEPDITIKDVWSVPVLRTNLWAAVMLYCEGTFNFYLLTFYMKYFPGNLFVNSVYFACSDLLAFCLAGVLLKVTSIKTAIRVGSTIAFIGGVLYMFFSGVKDLIPVFVCFSRLG